MGVGGEGGGEVGPTNIVSNSLPAVQQLSVGLAPWGVGEGGGGVVGRDVVGGGTEGWGGGVEWGDWVGVGVGRWGVRRFASSSSVKSALGSDPLNSSQCPCNG